MSGTIQPLVSIVLPTKNGERFLARSIESCLEQSWTNFELIVVNDASTDRTEEIIQSFAGNPKLRHRHSPTPLGLPRALNHGFAASSGELLTWTSDDNFYEKDAIHTLASALERDPRVGLVYSDENWVDEEGQFINVHETLHPDYLIECCCPGGSFMYRRSVMEAIGPYAEDSFLAEDYDYWLRIYVSGIPIKRISSVLYNYRKHASALGSLHEAKVMEVAERVRRRHLAPARITWLRLVRRLKVAIGIVKRGRSTQRHQSQ